MKRSAILTYQFVWRRQQTFGLGIKSRFVSLFPILSHRKERRPEKTKPPLSLLGKNSLAESGGGCKICFALFLFRQRQNTTPKGMNQLPLAVIQCPRTESIHQGLQLPRFGHRLLRGRNQFQPPLDVIHGPIIVGRHRAVIQPGIGQGGVNMLV